MWTERTQRFVATGSLPIAFLAACKATPDVPEPTPTDEILTMLPPISEFQWRQATPLERILYLETLNFPPIESFDPQKELVQSTAELFCHELDCDKSPREIAKNVFFLGIDEFLRELEKEEKRILTPKEREKESLERLEIITREDERILININGLKQKTETIRSKQPEFVQQLQPRDLETVLLAHILFHSFGHIIQTNERFVFESGFSAKLGERGINFDSLKGFRFVGETIGKNAKPFSVNFLTEAVAEHITLTLENKYFPEILNLVPWYTHGAGIILLLNQRAGITDEEFLRYAGGKLPLGDLIERWGTLNYPATRLTNEKAVILALFTIALDIANQVEDFNIFSTGVASYLTI